ncbi:hypothetical protein Tco_0359098 [Tanacetum coccineum]
MSLIPSFQIGDPNQTRRLGFVGFIKIANVERLVTNLCTIWVGSFRLHANIARFQRKPLNQNTSQTSKKQVNKHCQGEVLMEKVFNWYAGSFASAVKKGTNLHYEEVESKPALVLDDSCLNQSDVSTTLMGKVKEKFMANTSVVSWFSHLQQAMNTVFFKERVTWLDIKDQEEFCFHSKRVCVLTKLAETIFESFKIVVQGKVFWVRAKEACGWTPDFVEEDENESVYDDVVSEERAHEASEGLHKPKLLVGDSDVEEVSETIFEKFHSQTPNEDGLMLNINNEDENRPNYVQEEIISSSAKNKNTSNIWNEEIGKSVCSDHFKSNELLRSRGSILQVMEDMVKVGQTMGYNMEGHINNIEEIIKS